MPKLTVLVGPPGSGKSTLAYDLEKQGLLRISQDDQGKDHIPLFFEYVKQGRDIVVDRMGFNKTQRNRYLEPAKKAGYTTEIIVLHENYKTCLDRCIKRANYHPTITNEEFARNALQTFFTQYERPSLDEANTVEFRYPEQKLKLNAVICDIDGTAAQIDHRIHFVRVPEGQKKDWKSFLHPDNLVQDLPNLWCKELVNSLSERNVIVFCSGRSDNTRKVTQEWLDKNGFKNDWLFMRHRNDHRTDYIVKEILLDFEIKTRFNNIKFSIDDRQQVVDMWRNRGITCLQCANGDF